MLDRTFLAYTDMSTAVMSDTVMMPATDSQVNAAVKSPELEFAKCDCCGLTEECTQEYIENIRKRYNGNWMCGLCGEAVKDEIVRSGRLINTEEAVTRHMNFCRESGLLDQPLSPEIDLIAAMRRIIRRSLDSPRVLRSMPNSPLRSASSVRLSRSESCITNLAYESLSDLQEMME